MFLDRFQIGFWHPFGPHGGESPETILDRKKREVESNGWTLWSFQFRRLEAWQRQIGLVKPEAVFVFCSGGRGAKDPKASSALCQSYRRVEEGVWRRIPDTVKVVHPMIQGRR